MEYYLLEKNLQVVFQITAYGNLLALYWLTFYKLKCVFSQKSGCWWSCWVSAWQDILRLSGESINTNVGAVKRHYRLGKELIPIWSSRILGPKGQLISECFLGVIDFPKNQQKIWEISALESKKWSNQKSKSTFLQFMFSKKATKIDEIFTVDLTLCSKQESRREG